MSKLQINIVEIDSSSLTGTFEQIQEKLQQLKSLYPEAVGVDYEVSSVYDGVEKNFYVYRLETDEEFTARVEEFKKRLAEKEQAKQLAAKERFIKAAKDLNIDVESLRDLLK